MKATVPIEPTSLQRVLWGTLWRQAAKKEERGLIYHISTELVDLVLSVS